jgi:hypothetical protein
MGGKRYTGGPPTPPILSTHPIKTNPCRHMTPHPSLIPGYQVISKLGSPLSPSSIQPAYQNTETVGKTPNVAQLSDVDKPSNVARLSDVDNLSNMMTAMTPSLMEEVSQGPRTSLVTSHKTQPASTNHRSVHGRQGLLWKNTMKKQIVLPEGISSLNLHKPT